MFYVNQIAFNNLIGEEQKKNFELELASIMCLAEQNEGIRAFFIDKVGKPNWRYNTKNESDQLYDQVLKIKI